MLVLIAGITGQLGRRLATIAKSRGLSIRGLGRDPAKLEADISTSLESFITIENYYDITSLDKAVKGVDAVICAYNPHPVLDLDANLLLLRAAERAGVKVFIASSWNNDWTKLKFGEFEHYDTHIAFEQQAAMTSSIRPVYLFTGVFHHLLYTPYGPGAFDSGQNTAKWEYWGDGDLVKYSWTHLEDAAAWTIEILINGDGVKDGKGGFFRIRSGEHTIRELADAYHKFTGTQVQVVRRGSLVDLETAVAREREQKGRSRYFEYMPLAFALLSAKGAGEMGNPTVLDHVRTPATLQSVLREQFVESPSIH